MKAAKINPKCEIPCYSPEVPTCQCDHAYARGWKDGEQDHRLVMAGAKGTYPEDNYPSNPYHKSDSRWVAYNTGWYDGQQELKETAQWAKPKKVSTRL